MLKKKSNEPVTARIHSVISRGTIIKGALLVDECIRIDGEVEGNIVCRNRVITGPDSFIKGSIECANIEVMGKIEGNISCSEDIILRSSCVLNGDIKVKAIEIESGAVFEGSCSIINESADTPQEEESK